MHRSRHVLRLVVVAATLIVLGGVAAAQGAPPPPPPGGGYYQQPTGPIRSGFTGGLDIGFGLTNGAPDQGEGSTESGLSGLNVQLGSFVNPDLAINFRISGTTFSPEEFDATFVAGFLGVNAQYWAAPQIFVGGGLGLGYFTVTDCEGDDCSETALALNGRAGYEFWQSTTSAFHAALEITPAFYDGVRITSIGFQVGWQHY